MPGLGPSALNGDGGPATAAQLSRPSHVAADRAGNLYIVDAGNSRIRRVTPGGLIETVAGDGSTRILGSNGDGGPAKAASIIAPEGIAVDAAGNLYFASVQRIRKVTPGGMISTIAGTGIKGLSGDGGPAVSAQLSNPVDIAVDGAGNLYIADSENSRVRKVTPAGVISTIAGSAPAIISRVLGGVFTAPR